MKKKERIEVFYGIIFPSPSGGGEDYKSETKIRK